MEPARDHLGPLASQRREAAERRADDAEREVRAHITGYYRDSGLD